MTDYVGCRWTLCNLEGDVHGPLTHAGDEVEVMPVSEHETLRKAAKAVVEALNFYDSTLTTAYRNEQRPHVIQAARDLRSVLALDSAENRGQQGDT